MKGVQPSDNYVPFPLRCVDRIREREFQDKVVAEINKDTKLIPTSAIKAVVSSAAMVMADESIAALNNLPDGESK